MTTREFFNAIISTEGMPSELVDHATEALAKLDAANAKRKEKPSKTQIENEPIIKAIIDYVTENAGHSSTEIGVAVGISRNKSASLCSRLEKDGKLKRVRANDKKGSWLYSIA